MSHFSWQRVWAVVLRNMYADKRNIIRIADAVYWPTLDIALWGITSVWMAQSKAEIPNLVLVIMTALVFWQVVMRAGYEISVPLIEELWNKSLVTLFSTPLTIGEWIVGAMISGLFKTIFVLLFGGFMVWLLYALNIFAFGLLMIPFMVSLMLFGWVVGFLGAAMIICWGQKVQSLPWIMAFLFAPISSVYYPISVFPQWLQTVAYCFPTVYIFEGMRTVIFEGVMPTKYLIISLVLNCVYVAGALALFVAMFNKSRHKGLDRL